MISVTYGSGSAKGYLSEEDVCFFNSGSEASDVCSIDQRMLSVFYTSGLDGLSADGLLGLSPTASNRDAELFINGL